MKGRFMNGRFASVLADPPWRFINCTGKVAPASTDGSSATQRSPPMRSAPCLLRVSWPMKLTCRRPGASSSGFLECLRLRVASRAGCQATARWAPTGRGVPCREGTLGSGPRVTSPESAASRLGGRTWSSGRAGATRHLMLRGASWSKEIIGTKG